MSCHLAIDTSTEACSVALALDGAIRERFEPMEREHTARLLPMIEALLADCGRTLAQVDGIACGIGPGSFAGLRIGVGVVKGLALARELPVVGVSSLAMLAARAMRQQGDDDVVAVIDARMNEVYFGAYRRGADGGVSAVVGDLASAARFVPALPAGRWAAVGSGWARYETELRHGIGAPLQRIDAMALPHAEDALRLALPDFAAGRVTNADVLGPAYLRERIALTLAEQQALRE